MNNGCPNTSGPRTAAWCPPGRALAFASAHATPKLQASGLAWSCSRLARAGVCRNLASLTWTCSFLMLQPANCSKHNPPNTPTFCFQKHAIGAYGNASSIIRTSCDTGALQPLAEGTRRVTPASERPVAAAAAHAAKQHLLSTTDHIIIYSCHGQVEAVFTAQEPPQ